MNDRFRIQLVMEETLTVSEVWPDGDGPTEPTHADVLDVLHAAGDPLRVAREWSLDGAPEWSVGDA